MIVENIKAESRIEQTSEMLTRYIVEEKVQTGDFLPSEHQLSKMLGVGRSTLREAVKVLESKGLVKRFHGQGVKVVNESQKAASDMLKLSMKRNGSTIGELIEVRNIIEVKSATLAAERANADDLQQIAKALEIMQSKDVSLEAYVAADIDFHLSIARATHNSVLQLILETVRPLLHEAVLATLKQDPRPEQSLHYHEKIFNAITKKDAKSASRAMIEHLSGTEAMIKANKYQ